MDSIVGLIVYLFGQCGLLFEWLGLSSKPPSTYTCGLGGEGMYQTPWVLFLGGPYESFWYAYTSHGIMVRQHSGVHLWSIWIVYTHGTPWITLDPSIVHRSEWTRALDRVSNFFFNIKSLNLWATDEGVRGMGLILDVISGPIQDSYLVPLSLGPHLATSHHNTVRDVCTGTLKKYEEAVYET